MKAREFLIHRNGPRFSRRWSVVGPKVEAEETVTAIDERDVQPLVETLEKIQRLAHSVYIRQLAADALAQFSTQPEEKQR